MSSLYPSVVVEGVRVYVHRAKAEAALGHPLPGKAVIHHHGNVKDDVLVVCQDQAYHMLLERRTRALRECGNPHYRKCMYCQQYDDPINLIIIMKVCYHSNCRNSHKRSFFDNVDTTDAPLCLCGCGQKVGRDRTYKTKWNKFIFGHHPPTIKDVVAPLCACGCGGSVKRCSNNSKCGGDWNKYIHGHHRKKR